MRRSYIDWCFVFLRYSEDLPDTGDPILDEYMKLYNTIVSFKDGLAKVLLDKGAGFISYYLIIPQGLEVYQDLCVAITEVFHCTYSISC